MFGHFSTLYIKELAHYSPMLLSIPPENIRKPKGFLMFSGGLDKQHWAVIG